MFRLTLIVFTAVAAAACKPAAPLSTPIATPALAQAVPARATLDTTPRGPEQPEVERTLRGEIHTTKGAQLMLNGVIIPDNVLPPSGSDKRRARDNWLRKRVELRGLVKRYICRPMEQCLIGGSIPFVKRIDSLRELGPNE